VARSRLGRWGCCAACLTLAGLTCACSNAGPRSIDNPDPDQKIKAIIASDASQLPQLIRELEHDDSVTRFFAIEKLKRLTEEDFGYQYYVDEEKRAPAVQQWKAWLKGWQAARQSMGQK
jgi:hypothetical protein